MPDTTAALIEGLRQTLHTQIDAACDVMLSQMSENRSDESLTFKMPTLADGHDPLNKNGQNLTPRGVEILYRVFDDGGGYNRAAKMLNISQGAAKNRKGLWEKIGGKNRVKQVLDIDLAA